MKSNAYSPSTQQPLPPTKPAISSALEPLTRLEVDALRQKKKQISDYYQKVLAEKIANR